MAAEKNKLYYGDNLEVLRDYIADESVDLIYLDPPFNSRQDFNVLFAERDGSRSVSQITAFKDTWEWNIEAEGNYQEVVERGGRPADAMRAFRTLLGGSDMLAYLAMMAPRLLELRRVLKQTGSIYLHCDPTASHYLKLLMDSVFGPNFYRNEVIWKRTPFAGSSKARARQYPRSHDVLLFFSRSDERTWNTPALPYSEKYLERFRWDDHDGRGPYRKTLLKTYSQATFDRLREDNRLVEPIKHGAKWSYKQYLNESSGTTQIDDVWTDLNAINPVAKERLGYPTQKPEALLERILKASSNEGDVVLDPFCGCGTTVQVAQKLHRQWIGIDITHLAIGLIKTRLDDTFGIEVRKTYEVIGEPTDVSGAEQLAIENKWQFQYWALGLVGARPAEGIKKGADRGIDGRLYFHDDRSGNSKQIIFSVKGGQNVGVAEVRDLAGVLQREQADIGAYISFAEPTGPMKREAAEAGFYTSSDGTKYPKLQLLTIKGLLEGTHHLQRPLHVRDVTFKPAPRHRRTDSRNLSLPLHAE